MMACRAAYVSLLGITIIGATGWLYFLTLLAPHVNSQVTLHFPSSLKDLQELAVLLQLYYATSPAYVVLLFGSAYVYKQAFCIPGSVFLNILAGALFGVWIGFPLCCALTAIGSSFCYFLSKNIGKDCIQAMFPDKVKYLQLEVEKNRHRLFFYLLFLRLFPMSPNWLINLASPVVGIPYPHFFITATVGLMPYNFICTQTGEVLTSLTSLDRLMTFSTLLKLALLALVALGPSLFMRRRNNPRTVDNHSL